MDSFYIALLSTPASIVGLLLLLVLAYEAGKKAVREKGLGVRLYAMLCGSLIALFIISVAAVAIHIAT